MDDLPFWNRCAVAIASILSSVCASLFCHRETRSASTASTDAELQEPIARVSTSPIFPPGSSYQVFLSFRGEDTRKGFADHLYHALVNAGICVFRDDNDLRVGEEIGPELHRAISESKISIPILSERYASSKWCLQELTQMIARKNSSGHMVLPILYKVEPSHVRHQRGRFGKAFNSLRKHCEPKVVEEWEQVLKEVTVMKVWESEKIANGHEGELVKLVVETVLSELEHDFQLDVPENLVGIDRHVEEITRIVDANSNNTVMIGIYGMGGIGKTTLAKHIYNILSEKFVYRSFIADIRENGIQRSQRQLMSDILQSGHDVSRVDDGINIIKSRFRSKRLLIVLDDVDHEDQLDNLTRERTWFGFGSKIIVTTRDEGVLDRAKFGVDCKYELDMLDQQQSLLLFCRHAFRSDSPLSEFQLLSHDVVETTGGLPLALEVIGSLLFGIRDLKAWEDTIKKLRNAPEEKVQEKLKISYNGLDYETQQIFLDIACFFDGWDTAKPTYLWDDYNFAPRIRIHLLVCRCLLKIEENKFKMHDQLRDLGRAMIRQEDYNEPKNRSRLWDWEEARSVLDRNEGSEKIQAIHLYHPDISQSAGAFKIERFEKLPNLRMLRAFDADLGGDFQNSFSELRWLLLRRCSPSPPSCSFFHWVKGDPEPKVQNPQPPLPVLEWTNFHSEKLVILELLKTSISEDWTGWSSMKRLKVLDLSDHHDLENSPDLSHCTNLEILSLQKCFNLKRIHHSIGAMKTLVSLNLSKCYKLKELPAKVSGLQELKHLVIDMTAISETPKWIVSLKKLETLSAESCQRLARIPKIGNLHSLKVLRLKHTSISSLPEMISNLSSLQVLDVQHCDQLGSILELPSRLMYLGITCNSITLPNLSELVHLKELNLQHCKRLEFILDLPSSLLRLNIDGCIKLEKLPNLSHLKQLIELQLLVCPKLSEIIGLEGLTSLTRLHVSGCPKLSRFDGLKNLEASKNLDMSLDNDDDETQFVGIMEVTVGFECPDGTSLRGPTLYNFIVKENT